MLALQLLPYPDIDPVLIEVGPLAVRWYALSYLAGIILGYLFVRWLDRGQRLRLLSNKQTEDMMLWAVIGIMLGGRLGYAFFYKPEYFLSHPQEILAVWKGGMAFHGGLIGIILAFYGFAKRHAVPYLPLMDRIACAAPIGLFFGRLANFINGELYGRIADCAHCMVFPGGGPFARHPSQLYEALLEGLALFAVLNCLRAYTSIAQRPGSLSGLFLLGYGAARFVAEQFREPDAHLGFIWGEMTMGQLLSVPMLLLGIFLMIKPVNGQQKRLAKKSP